MSELLVTKDLTKKYGSKLALNNVNLSIERGHIIGLLGPNGSGKTTFIKILNGLLTPSSGEILVNGERVGVNSKKVISYLPDVNYLNMGSKVSELIKMFKLFYEDFDVDKAYSLLEKLNINPGDSLKSMSKGTKEKVQLILVMSRNADIYVLDEPTTGLHFEDVRQLLNVLNRLVDSGNTVLVIEHNLDVIKCADHIVDLGPEGGDGGGKIIATGTPEEVSKIKGSYTGEFLKKIL